MISSEKERRSLRFSDTVDPGDSDIFTFETERDCTVERMEVRVYRGAEFDLLIEPFVDRNKSNDRRRREDIIVYRGSEIIAGDADKFQFDVSKSVQDGQEIGVEVTNQDGEYAYDFVVDMTLEYAGGLSRILGGVL